MRNCGSLVTGCFPAGVAAYVGWQSSSILKPLLQQGLSDVEEFVIYKALNALTCMCQLGLLQKPHIYEFVSDIGERSALLLCFCRLCKHDVLFVNCNVNVPKLLSCVTPICGSATEPWVSSLWSHNI